MLWRLLVRVLPSALAVFGVGVAALLGAAVSGRTDKRRASCLSSIPSINSLITTRSSGSSRMMANDFIVQRGNGRMHRFGNASNLGPAADINDRVTKASNGWQVYNASNDATEFFDLTGRLTKVTARNGQIQTLAWSNSATPVSIAPKAGLLIGVTSHFGRQLNFTYDSASRMASMIDPSGGVYTYAYDEASSIALSGNPTVGNLTSVTYPDGKKRIYWYNEQDKTGNTNQPFALTGITDENGVRFATWHYDAQERAVSSEHAGGVEKYNVTYPNLYATSQVIDRMRSMNTSPSKRDPVRIFDHRFQWDATRYIC